MQKVLAVKVNA